MLYSVCLKEVTIIWAYKNIRGVYFYDCWMFENCYLFRQFGEMHRGRLSKGQTAEDSFNRMQSSAERHQNLLDLFSFPSSSRSRLEWFQFILTSTKPSHIVGMSLIVFTSLSLIFHTSFRCFMTWDSYLSYTKNNPGLELLVSFEQVGEHVLQTRFLFSTWENQIHVQQMEEQSDHIVQH